MINYIWKSYYIIAYSEIYNKRKSINKLKIQIQLTDDNDYVSYLKKSFKILGLENLKIVIILQILIQF